MRTKSDIDKAYKPNGITDNRMQWLMKLKGVKGITINWGGNPSIMDLDGYILPKKAEKIMYSDFDLSDEWPKCPYSGKKLPIADSHDITKSNFGL